MIAFLSSVQADGTEEIEAIAVADFLTHGGMKVTLASVGCKLQNIVTMSQGTKVQGNIAIEACSDLSFDLIMCPGARALISFVFICHVDDARARVCRLTLCEKRSLGSWCTTSS